MLYFRLSSSLQILIVKITYNLLHIQLLCLLEIVRICGKLESSIRNLYLRSLFKYLKYN